MFNITLRRALKTPSDSPLNIKNNGLQVSNNQQVHMSITEMGM